MVARQMYAIAAAAAVAAAVLPLVDGRGFGRPLNHRIKHFEPVQIHNHHVSRRSAEMYSDPRPIGNFTIEMEVAGKPLTLKMEPHNNLYAPGAYVHHISADGTQTKRSLTYKGLYRGVADEHRGSFVHLHIDEQQAVRGIVVLHGKKEALHIEPASMHYDTIDPTDFNHVIYKESDIDYPRNGHSETMAHPPVAMDQTLFGEAAPAKAGEHPGPEQSSDEQSGSDARDADPEKRGRRHAGGEDGDVDEGSRLDDAVSVSTYTYERKVCAIALWADKEFIDLCGGVSDATVRILQRWTVAQTVFDETSFAPYVVQIQIKHLVVDESASFASTAPTAIDWLKQFATRGPSRDWHHVCLAHGFTNIDYSGTLGLAYTAPSPEKKNDATGGICQASYAPDTKIKGDEVYHNTGMSTSENFGSTVGELQLSLVLAHEFGHNFGTGHDCNAPCTAEENLEGTAGGNYLMYPMSVSGADSNNEIFSPMSVDAMTAAVGYRGGCFEVEGAGTCGNYITDQVEECDCGGESGCLALGDKCCGSDCTFTVGSKCSPLDSKHGMCCTEDCGVLSGVDCRIQDTCRSGAKCTAPDATSGDTGGECPDVTDRAENSLCENGISICAEGQCSGLCDDAGGCTKSICKLWGLEESATTVGSGACKIYCDKDGVPVAPADLTIGMTLPGWAWDGSAANTNDVAIKSKAPGARCLFLEGDHLSGVCDQSGVCVSADTEEDLMGELLGFYNQFVDTFQDWLYKETHGLSNIGWFCVSASLLMVSCCLCCYCENHDRARKHQDFLRIKARLCCKKHNGKVNPGDEDDSGDENAI